MPPKITNVFHFDANNRPFSGVPYLDIHPDGYFEINFDNWRVKKDIVLGKQYPIAIIQYRQSQKYWYEVIIDDVQELMIYNHVAKSFPNVKVYLSDPWKPSFSSNFGSLCNLNLFGKFA